MTKRLAQDVSLSRVYREEEGSGRPLQFAFGAHRCSPPMNVSPLPGRISPEARRFYLQCFLYVRNDRTPATLLLRFMPGVLIADDSANIRVLLRTFIETQTGFKVCAEAKSGVEAIEKAKELLPDVALLDLAMPDLNGIEVASVLKRAVPGIKLILFTMKVDGLGRSLASAIGIDFILSKEESITKLTEHLKSLIPASAAASATGNT
jgi:CheY-like chemotaxis protein